jgi:uncharacterized oligopeptide transporter (OPT) family protein
MMSTTRQNRRRGQRDPCELCHSLDIPIVNCDASASSNALTLRTIAIAVLIGTGICFANVYFGLQAGIVNAMPMPAALVGFTFFKSISERLRTPFSPAENTVLQVIAGALGAMPFTSGYTGVIPALEFLTTPSENGPVRFTVMQLLLWSLGICLLGIVVAAPLRWLFILQEKLRFPSATATAVLIGLLHGDEKIAARAKEAESANTSESDSISISPDEQDCEVSEEQHAISDQNQGQRCVKILIRSFTLSYLFVSLLAIPSAQV